MRYLLDEWTDAAMAAFVPILYAPVAFWLGMWVAYRVAEIHASH